MKKLISIVVLIIAVGALAACTTRPTAVNPDLGQPRAAQAAEPADETSGESYFEAQSAEGDSEAAMQAAAQEADVSYTLVTSTSDGMAFVGRGGDIDGEVNPILTAQPGDVVSITLVNGDSIAHDLTIDAFDVQTEQLVVLDSEETVTFTVDEAGEYLYYCSLPGHQQAGMWGNLVVGEPQQEAGDDAQSIVHHPAELPAPVGEREPETIELDLVAQELEGQLADGTNYTYWTFNGTVPGPFIRVRVGDTVELTLENEAGSQFPHSIDLHAVNGPGGGAVHTETNPGESNGFTFQALNPGLYVYHCATPSVAQHISNGMYGLILVEPEGGLPEVDKEFYVMQGEIYTLQPYGERGQADFDYEKMLNEQPEYFVFNGAAGALTQDENALQAEVGDTVRIFFGVGGPNFTSSFHVIGEIFDRAYPFAALTSEPLTDVQTVTVPPGGATMVEFEVDVPGTYILVDHALSRAERGLVGYLNAEGPENADVFTEGTGN